MRRAARAFAVAAVGVGTVLVTAAPASAATYEEATWYYAKYNLAANLAVANGSGVSIALIDTSIDTSVPELSNATIKTQPSECLLNGSADPVNSTTDATHATQMAVVLAGNGTGTWDGRGGKGVAPGATILHYRNGTVKTDGSDTNDCLNAQGTDVYDQATSNAIEDAVSKGARVVNMSFGGSQDMPLTVEAMGAAEAKGVVFVAATDDKPDSKDPERLGKPVSYNGVVAVNGNTPTLTLAPDSSLSDLVTVVAPGDTMCVGGINPATGAWDSTGVFGGSSPAAAFTSGIIADAMSKWPKATGNQIIQLLVRTTGGTLHEIPSRAGDGFGFGTPSLTAMYENDPTQFPDENPLLRDDAEPLTSDIVGSSSSSSAAPSDAPSTASSPRPSQVASARDDSGSSWPLFLGIGIAVVVVVVVLVVVLVLRSRRRPPGGGAPPPGGGAGWAGPPPNPQVHQPTG